jgi:hypothetical protein
MNDEILMVIAKYFSFKFEVIKEVYAECKSFDATMRYCEVSKEYNISPFTLCSMVLDLKELKRYYAKKTK